MHHAPVGQVGRDAFAQALLFAAAGKAGFKQRFARRGQGETFAIARDQRLAQLVFQLAQMLRHARLGHVKALRRAGEMAGLAKGGEGLKPGGVQHGKRFVMISMRFDNFTCEVRLSISTSTQTGDRI